MFNGMDMGDLLSKAKEIQKNMEEQKAEASKQTVESQVGGGMVKVTMSGEMEVKSITLDPEIVDKDDLETLQDLIAAAMNEATRKAKELGGGGGMADMMKNFKMPDLGNFDPNMFKK